MKRTVPLIKPDLPSFETVSGSFKEILSNGKVTNFGKYAALFESSAGDYLGTHAAVVSSGTIGLILTLQALGLEAGQEVILPSFSFMATAQAVLYAGGRPVFADVEPDFTLSLADLEFLLSSHRSAAFVIPVHTYGYPCDGEKIQGAVDRFAGQDRGELHVIYDAAHAFGARRDGRRVGAFGDAEVFSLSVTKALVSVEGGLVSSRDAPLIRRIKKMRNYGIEDGYEAHWPGLNGKMSEFHAIIGLNNLKGLEEALSLRAKKAAYYSEQIRRKSCFLPAAVAPQVTHTFKDFCILVPPELKGKRDAVANFLNNAGIETRTYFHPPIHEQKFFRRFSDRALPVTEDLSRRVITLPFFTTISEEEMDWVVQGLAKAQEAIA